jgi:type II secretory pathway pseudopilin PulG
MKPYKRVGATGRTRHTAAFTLVEIALSLAVIGFALVAIIGILPTGMNVQKENREETIVNFDSAFLLDAIRSGTRGQDDLTNYIICITNRALQYKANGQPVGNPLAISFYTLTNYSYNNGAVQQRNFLTNGFNIMGLLSTPKYLYAPSGGYTSNSITADFRGISGPVVEQGTNQASKDFAFRYRVTLEIVPDVEYDGSWTNYTASLLSPTDVTARSNYMTVQAALRHNLNQVRLRFNWPVLPNGRTGNGRQVFRTVMGGPIYTNVAVNKFDPPLYFIHSKLYDGQDQSK